MRLWVGVSLGVLAAWILAWALGAPPWLDWLLLLAWFGSVFWLFFRDLPGPPRRYSRWLRRKQHRGPPATRVSGGDPRAQPKRGGVRPAPDKAG
jgi:hypothetical protein